MQKVITLFALAAVVVFMTVGCSQKSTTVVPAGMTATPDKGAAAQQALVDRQKQLMAIRKGN